MSDLVPLLEAPYATIEDVIDGLAAVERVMRGRRDRRAVFAAAYLEITRAIARGVRREGFFLDPEWVLEYDVAFANLYRQALLDFERGEIARVPKAWRFSFETSASGDGLVLQDLLLGVNAHINHDLALTLFGVGVDPRDGRHADHTRVNDVLNATVDALQERVARAYAPALAVLDRVAGRLDEEIAGFSVAKAREASWRGALSLANARDDAEREGVRRGLDDNSAVLARLILSALPHGTPLMTLLRQAEQRVPWWELIAVPAGSGGPAAPVVADRPMVESIDELIGRLEETAARFDSRRSRLSIYPSMYRIVCRRMKEALDAGEFEDRAWAEALDRYLATRWLRALEAHEGGRPPEVPSSWRAAFAAAEGGKTTLLQDLALSVSARLNHDLPIALLHAGIGPDREARRRDLMAFHAVFRRATDAVQEMMAAKYSRVVGVLDVAGLRLDEWLADRQYRRAADAAWDNAVRLADAASDAERAELLGELDRRAAVLADAVLLRGISGVGWIAHALRAVEDRFGGRWSEWVEDEK